MPRRAKRPPEDFDTELADLPEPLRWRIWMGRAEAVIFASPIPVTRETIACVVGRNCNIEELIEDIRGELTERPFDLIKVAGSWQHRTRRRFADAVRHAGSAAQGDIRLSLRE